MNEKELFDYNYRKQFEIFLNALVNFPEHDCHRGPEDACPICDSEEKDGEELLRCVECGAWVSSSMILPNGLCEGCYNQKGQ
jgi:hypothetical protein